MSAVFVCSSALKLAINQKIMESLNLPTSHQMAPLHPFRLTRPIMLSKPHRHDRLRRSFSANWKLQSEENCDVKFSFQIKTQSVSLTPSPSTFEPVNCVSDSRLQLFFHFSSTSPKKKKNEILSLPKGNRKNMKLIFCSLAALLCRIPHVLAASTR